MARNLNHSRYVRHEPKPDMFDRIERNFGKIAAVWITLGLLFWGTVIFIALHFIAKVW